MANPARVVWTYQDLELMPEDGRRHEILDGDWVVTPSPTTTHQSVSKRLERALITQLEDTKLGVIFYAPTDVIFSNTRVCVPDLLFVREERRSIIKERGIEGPPDLIIEILSPGTQKADRETKRKLYADERLPEYWPVDPSSKSVEVLLLKDTGYELFATFGENEVLHSALLPFSVELTQVFNAP